MSFVQNYSSLDKILHYIAFSVPSLQKTLCDLENNIYKKNIASVKNVRPVFVTALPRAGTTLLLDLLFKTGEFNTFSYRHMPFILSPLLWRKLSSRFAKKAEKIQRAHGDGMEVSFDSPEAFEEVIWLSYLKNKYVKKNRIECLNLNNTSKEFAENFKLIIKKLLLESTAESKRYISKNNTNCSRLPVLTHLFPSSIILVPFREPMAHIGSLIKQHKQFCEMHKEDKFPKNYMRWLGHYDFGLNFKPINFEHWLDSMENEPDYSSEDFWLQYWISAYSAIIENKSDNIYFVDFDKLLISPEDSLKSIANIAGLKNKEKFIEYSTEIRKPTSKSVASSAVHDNNLEQAQNLHKKLKDIAI